MDSRNANAQGLRKWAERHRVSFANLIIPHVFGEFGKPFYNSVVSTFCHQLATGDNLNIVDDGPLELIHTQQLAARILQAALNKENGDVRVKGVPIKVSELLSRLRRMSDLYRSHTVPDLRNLLDLHLFNTYRSCLFPTFYPVSVELHQDGRGQLFEAVRSLNGGQIFLSTTHPGITRGNHYHMRKMERFLVAQGDAVIRIRKLFSCEVREFQVGGECPRYIDMPSFHTHSIENNGASDLITLFWANEVFDSNDTDTYTEQVLAQ
jgi:UDP-2-acetamido-2,6-beta-L-arabino-hexul-4-ose reductase